MKPNTSEFRMRDELLNKLGLKSDSSPEDSKPSLPFSFITGEGKKSADIQEWSRSVSGEGTLFTVTWRNSELHLAVSAEVKCFDDSAAVDYVCRFANEGNEDMGILADILPLDAMFEIKETDSLALYHAEGSMCVIDDFLPQTSVIATGKAMDFAPRGGRSSDGVLPFFNLEYSGGGMVLAIGWSGQWKMRLERQGLAFSIKAGMEKTHLRLRPGESIRTPRILLIRWDGEDRFRGHNLMRSVILNHYLQRVDGQPTLAPLAHNTAAACCMRMAKGEQNANEKNQLEAISRCKALNIDAYWMDAYWFVWPWHLHVGSWIPRPNDFPQGLRPLADAAHAKGLKFVLWYEPERVVEGTVFDKEHPEFLIKLEGQKNRLFNLGDPAALKFMVAFLSNEIEKYSVDIYRQDFNFRPLPYWQAADAPDRQGISEIRYIEGLYALWSELIKRHPGLVIDSCASGGRRIDLETCSLSLPLWRTDYTDGAYSSVKLAAIRQAIAPIADQVQTSGLNLFIPSVHIGAVGRYEPYGFRSAISTGAIIYTDITAKDFPDALFKSAVKELKRLRPCLLGDFYPLTPVSTDADVWCAHQYDRPEEGDGIALYFCRQDCESLSHPANLRSIDPDAQYQVVISEDYKRGKKRKMTGKKLAALEITAQFKPSAILLEYKKLGLPQNPPQADLPVA